MRGVYINFGGVFRNLASKPVDGADAEANFASYLGRRFPTHHMGARSGRQRLA